MSTKSSCCVVVNEGNEVLLVLREDFRIWTLPGGGVDPNESWEQAAIRETLEETGYEVMIQGYVGEYWRPQLSNGQGDLRRVFIAEPIGTIPSKQDKESVDVRWLPVNSLPKRMNRFVREQLMDALSFPSSPLHKEQNLPLWMAIAVRLAVLLRNVRNRILRPQHK